MWVRGCKSGMNHYYPQVCSPTHSLTKARDRTRQTMKSIQNFKRRILYTTLHRPKAHDQKGKKSTDCVMGINYLNGRTSWGHARKGACKGRVPNRWKKSIPKAGKTARGWVKQSFGAAGRWRNVRDSGWQGLVKTFSMIASHLHNPGKHLNMNEHSKKSLRDESDNQLSWPSLSS